MTIHPEAFAHEKALVDEGVTIGPGTKVWAFTHLLSGAQIGADCKICEHVYIEGDVVVGDRVTVKCGVQLWNGLRLEDGVFIGPNLTFTNDLFPRSKRYPEAFLQTQIKAGASIGGGGCNSSWTHHWREGDGGRWQCGHQVGAGWRGGGGQSCSDDSPAGGGQR